MASSYDFDVFVIGAGSAGVRCARIAANLGAKVGVAENRYLGGTCVNVGCVPKKLMVHAAQCSSMVASAQRLGWQLAQPTFDWHYFLQKKDAEIARLNGVYRKLLLNSGASVFDGTACISSPGVVTINDESFSCRNIVIATGSWPRKNDYPGAELALTSNEIFHLETLPERILIEGGGYIAVEFAGIFNGLGCRTELLYRGPVFLKGFGDELGRRLAEQYKKKGIDLFFDTEITQIKQQQGLVVADSHGRLHHTDLVLSAIGRVPHLEGLGLESLDVELTDKGAIKVNSDFQTSQAGIYALGDVVGRMPLTPVALAEGQALAHHLVEGTAINLDYRSVATAIFSDPEIATVGMTVAQAQRAGHVIETFVSEFRPLKHTLTGRDEKTWLQMVVDRPTDRVLGCHMMGEYAAEMMQGIAIALKMGATKADFDATVGIHPTSAEEWVTLK